LYIDVQDHIESLLEQFFDSGCMSGVQVAVNFGRFEELAATTYSPKFVLADEVVIHTVLLFAARLASRVRNREPQSFDSLQCAFGERRLTGARRSGHNYEVAALGRLRRGGFLLSWKSYGIAATALTRHSVLAPAVSPLRSLSQSRHR